MIYLRILFQMAYLRKGHGVTDNIKTDIDNTEEEKQKDDPVKDNTTIVIFIGLLLDLLGDTNDNNTNHHNTNTAFTLILPLFPSLISHYRDQDQSGLFKLLENKVRIIQQMILLKMYLMICRLMCFAR